MSARAAGWLLARGVRIGKRVAVIVDPSDGSGPFGEAYARALTAIDANAEVKLVHGTPIAVEGSAAPKAVTFRDAAGKESRLKIDALVIDAPRAPAYELCEQAGAPLTHTARGYVPSVKHGKIRDRFFAIGEVAGSAFEARVFGRAADEIAAQI
jgi:hypothetical protein